VRVVEDTSNGSEWPGDVQARANGSPLIAWLSGDATTPASSRRHEKSSKHGNERAEPTAARKPGGGFWLAQVLNARSAIIPIPTASTANATGSYSSQCTLRCTARVPVPHHLVSEKAAEITSRPALSSAVQKGADRGSAVVPDPRHLICVGRLIVVDIWS
jgi:hypothetical protein